MLLLVKAYNPYSAIRPGQSTLTISHQKYQRDRTKRGGDKLIACVKPTFTVLFHSHGASSPSLYNEQQIIPSSISRIATTRILGYKLAASIRYLPASGSLVHPPIISSGVGDSVAREGEGKGQNSSSTSDCRFPILASVPGLRSDNCIRGEDPGGVSLQNVWSGGTI